MNGQLVKTAQLEDYEVLGHDGVEYECFNTSGGLGTLPETLEGKARSVSYRSIRYPGHCEILKLLLHDLGLERRRDLLKEIFEAALPRTDQDVVSGLLHGQRHDRRSAAREIPDQQKLRARDQRTGLERHSGHNRRRCSGRRRSDAHRCVLPSTGFVRQEQVNLCRFPEHRIWPRSTGPAMRHPTEQGGLRNERRCDELQKPLWRNLDLTAAELTGGTLTGDDPRLTGAFWPRCTKHPHL